ncbi:MarR family winged helix-turn-helix transcriptional regulator [Halalkalibacter sp. APA_J-10(15)]|uniref:MarR family winged helix-turn-helix transcriptional regulator n=1 Tax=unclassified Halalkalibacter TaxID=2893063 RepID=UPI001FF19646|nr:MarR family transcriptional regulator [Halalkalibacter sp. APA_J-10(15)]MCK0471179.1 MarR family transcriptional regulator [Halalkalibacter sp. APA_J-10(15)]
MNVQNQSKELTELLYSISDRFHTREQEQLCCYDISASECRTLSYLKRDSERTITMNELAKQLNITRGGATRVIDKLIDKGYVLRKTHPGDGRACCIVLSPQGSELIDRIEVEVALRNENILKKLDPAMCQVVIASLQALNSAMQQVQLEEGGDE